MQINKWKYLQIAITLFLLLVIVYKVDFVEIYESLSRCNVFFIICVTVLAILDRMVMAYKWNILLKAGNIEVPYMLVLKSYFVSSFLGSFLTGIGGEATKIYYIIRKGVSKKKILSSIVIERILGCVAIIIVALFAAILFVTIVAPNFNYWKVISLLVLAVIGTVSIFSLSLSPNIFKWVMKSLDSRSEGKVIGMFMRFYVSYMEYNTERKALAMFFVWTLFEQLFPIFGLYFLIHSLGIDVTFIHVLLSAPFIMLLSRLPIAVEGVGVQEIVYMGALSFIGISNSDSVLISLVARATGFICIVPWLPFLRKKTLQSQNKLEICNVRSVNQDS